MVLRFYNDLELLPEKNRKYPAKNKRLFFYNHRSDVKEESSIIFCCSDSAIRRNLSRHLSQKTTLLNLQHTIHFRLFFCHKVKEAAFRT